MYLTNIFETLKDCTIIVQNIESSWNEWNMSQFFCCGPFKLPKIAIFYRVHLNLKYDYLIGFQKSVLMPFIAWWFDLEMEKYYHFNKCPYFKPNLITLEKDSQHGLSTILFDSPRF